MTEVLVLGALHYDVVVDAPGLPGIDETLVGHAVDYRFGGKGGNQAVAAARMGVSVEMLGRVGSDAAAEVMRAALTEAGVGQDGVMSVAGSTGMSVAITLPDGDYGAVFVSGANLTNDGARPEASTPRVAVIQNEIPEPANVRFAEGLPDETYLIWNAAPARGLPAALAARVNLLVVNRVEARDMTQLSDPRAAALALSDLVRGDVIVTLGGEGLVLASGSEPIVLPAPKVDVVSTHGAGDMFVGALAAQIARGASLTSACEHAQKVAARFVSLPIKARAEISDMA